MLFHVMQVIGIRDVIPPPIPQAFHDVYVATELMDTDLHHIIRSNQDLSEEHCQVMVLVHALHFIPRKPVSFASLGS